MVKKIGFIGEGFCEVMVLSSDKFNNYLQKNNLSCVGVFDAQGNGQFQNNNPTMRSFFYDLNNKGAEKIIVLMDIEAHPCITSLLETYHTFGNNQINIVSKKALESWFLSDSTTLSHLFNEEFFFEEPENTVEMPYQVIRKLFKRYNVTGSRTKVMLTKKMIENGFDIENCLKHPNISSLKYFDRILKSI